MNILNDTQTYETFMKNEKSIIKFSTPWCGPCKILDPVFDRLDIEFSEVEFGKVDIEENSILQEVYDLRSVPTLIFFKDGEEIHRHIGAISENSFRSKIIELFS